VVEAWIDGLETGASAASRSTWYRIARRMTEARRPVRPRRRTPQPQRSAPVLLAAGPNQVWSWDITDLKSLIRGHPFKGYAIQDLFSRKIVGHHVAERESGLWAADMFAAAFARETARPGCVHADSGAPMRSVPLLQLFTEHHITESHSRPRVSNDNPYSEAGFRTMKYRPGTPPLFESLPLAQDHVEKYVTWYNSRHHHSGIGYYTPNEVHDGSWTTKHQRRQQALDAYAQARPERFHGRHPLAQVPPGWAGINSPGPAPAPNPEMLQSG
jgi:putative transposase